MEEKTSSMANSLSTRDYLFERIATLYVPNAFQCWTPREQHVVAFHVTVREACVVQVLQRQRDVHGDRGYVEQRRVGWRVYFDAFTFILLVAFVADPMSGFDFFALHRVPHVAPVAPLRHNERRWCFAVMVHSDYAGMIDSPQQKRFSSEVFNEILVRLRLQQNLHRKHRAFLALPRVFVLRTGGRASQAHRLEHSRAASLVHAPLKFQADLWQREEKEGWTEEFEKDLVSWRGEARLGDRDGVLKIEHETHLLVYPQVRLHQSHGRSVPLPSQSPASR